MRVLGLKSSTDPAWAQTALGDEVALLSDHAHLERKAAGHGMSLIGWFPEQAPAILEVVREEMEHFERVYALLAERGEVLGPDGGNPYVRRLMRAGDKTLLSRVLRMGLVEARSFERFSLLADAASGQLAQLYADLRESEAGHHAFFLKLAYGRWPRPEVQACWQALATLEAEIVAGIEWGPRIH